MSPRKIYLQIWKSLQNTHTTLPATIQFSLRLTNQSDLIVFQVTWKTHKKHELMKFSLSFK